MPLPLGTGRPLLPNNDGISRVMFAAYSSTVLCSAARRLSPEPSPVASARPPAARRARRPITKMPTTDDLALDSANTALCGATFADRVRVGEYGKAAARRRALWEDWQRGEESEGRWPSLGGHDWPERHHDAGGAPASACKAVSH